MLSDCRHGIEYQAQRSDYKLTLSGIITASRRRLQERRLPAGIRSAELIGDSQQAYVGRR
jgi:hypothetical protein